MADVFKVALLIETSNRYGRDLLYGVRDWIQKRGEKWSIRFTEQARRAPLPGWLADWQGDGVIARVDSPSIASALKKAKLPVVDVSADRPKSEFPRVSIDNEAVARLAVAHLKDKGLRNIAFIGDLRFTWARQREEEFRRLMEKMGQPCRIYKGPAADKENTGSDSELRGIVRWLQNLPRPVGIFACNDNRALQVLEACQLTGFTVPDDVAVIGVDDDEVLCHLCNPPLSSVLPNARLTGYEAAAMISRMMHGERLASQTQTIAPIRVVERQSTDVTAVSDPKIASAVRYINEHACEGIDVSDVLRAVPVSRTLFDARFKTLLGHSPHQHIVNKRIERAKHLLFDSDLAITVIAELSGFLNASYLSTVFRRETGMTPYAYRTKLRTNQGGKAP
jgi:LacI family transcriptional regulator